MNEVARKKRNEDRLIELHPNFRVRVARVIDTLESEGFRPRIQDAWRSTKKQLQHFENGTSLTKFGFHNITTIDGNPDALAVDLLDDNAPNNPGTVYLLHLAAAAEAEGLITGIRWGLPPRFSAAIDAAIAEKNWTAKVRTGWDKWHVEPADITIAQAKSGIRPA